MSNDLKMLKPKKGDILLFKTDGSVQDIFINRVSYYTHVALYTENDFIIDSDLLRGVSEHKLNKSLNYIIYRTNLTEREINVFINEFRKLKGRKYDLAGGIQGFFVNLFFRSSGILFNIGNQDEKNHHCSEAFCIAAQNANIIKSSINPENILPDHIILLFPGIQRIG